MEKSGKLRSQKAKEVRICISHAGLIWKPRSRFEFLSVSLSESQCWVKAHVVAKRVFRGNYCLEQQTYLLRALVTDCGAGV